MAGETPVRTLMGVPIPILPPEEVARRKEGARRLKLALSTIPYYARLAESPDADVIFETMYGSCVNAPFRRLPGEDDEEQAGPVTAPDPED